MYCVVKKYLALIGYIVCHTILSVQKHTRLKLLFNCFYLNFTWSDTKIVCIVYVFFECRNSKPRNHAK